MKYSFGPIDSTRLHFCGNRSNRAGLKRPGNGYYCVYLFIRFIVTTFIVAIIVIFVR